MGSSNVASKIPRRTPFGPSVKAEIICALGEIANAQPAPGAGSDALPLRWFRSALRGLVFGHELGCEWRATNTNFRATFGAQINSEVAVPVTVFDAARRKSAGHGGLAYLAHTEGVQSSTASWFSSGRVSIKSSSELDRKHLAGVDQFRRTDAAGLS